MYEFPRVKATEASFLNRSVVHGVGINDAWYKISDFSNGKQRNCPVYDVWAGVLKRVYGKSRCANTARVYADCSVCDEWLTFSVYQEWHDANHIKGYELDKDLLVEGNRIYSPDTCLFVPPWLNSLLTKLPEGKHGTGVHIGRGKANPYQAHATILGKNKSFGYYATPEIAQAVYKAEKGGHICDLVLTRDDVPSILVERLYLRGLSMMIEGYKYLRDVDVPYRTGDIPKLVGRRGKAKKREPIIPNFLLLEPLQDCFVT